MLRGSRAPIVAGAGAVVLAALLMFFLVLPKMGQVSTRERRPRGRPGAAAARWSPSSQRSSKPRPQHPRPRRPSSDVEQQIPPTADEPGLLLLIRNAAARSGVVLSQLTPGTPTLDATTGLSTIPLAVTASGSYFQIAEFLYSIETLPRAAKVLTIALAPGAGSEANDDDRDQPAAAAGERGAVHERPERRAGFGARSDRGCRGRGGSVTCR